jgi:hypothetical protein
MFCHFFSIFVYIPPKVSSSLVVNPKGDSLNGTDEAGKGVLVFTKLNWLKRFFFAKWFVVYLPNLIAFIGYIIYGFKKVLINPFFWLMGRFYVESLWFLPVLFLRFLTFFIQIFIYLSLLLYCLSELFVEVVEIFFCFLTLYIIRFIKKVISYI